MLLATADFLWHAWSVKGKASAYLVSLIPSVVTRCATSSFTMQPSLTACTYAHRASQTHCGVDTAQIIHSVYLAMPHLPCRHLPLTWLARFLQVSRQHLTCLATSHLSSHPAHNCRDCMLQLREVPQLVRHSLVSDARRPDTCLQIFRRRNDGVKRSNVECQEERSMESPMGAVRSLHCCHLRLL